MSERVADSTALVMVEDASQLETGACDGSSDANLASAISAGALAGGAATVWCRDCQRTVSQDQPTPTAV